MSHWDFGRRPDAEHDARLPAEPSGTARQPDPLPGADDAWAARDGWAPGDVPTVETPQLAESTWPTGTLWEADEHWAAGEGWPPSADASQGDGWPSGDTWEDEDEGTAPYPLTYERDDPAAAPPLPPSPPSPPPTARPAPPPDAPWGPWPSAPYPVSHEVSGVPAAPFGQDAGPGTAAGAQRDNPWRAGFAGLGRPDAEGAGWPGTAPAPDEFPGGRPGRGRPCAGRGGRRWLVLAGVVAAGAAVGATAVLVANGSPGSQAGPAAGRAGQQSGAAAPPVTPAARASASASASSPAPPLTPAQAKAVLAGYTTVNNNANATRSGTLLAAVETGSSYAIDAGLYRVQQGTAPFPAFGPARATYYIPHDEPAAGPRWFVVQVANAFSASPAKVTSNEYLLFTQQVPGGPWQDAVEPYLIAGASVPRIAVGADGLATAVSLDTLAVAAEPSQLPAATAASLDGTGNTPGQPAVHAPGNLADVGDQEFWAGKLPDGKVTDVHTAAAGAAGQEFALRTADGGALVFYTDAAQVTLTPPAGTMLHLTVPGFYSPAQGLSQAGMSYLEQFATYDPPAGAGQAPSVVADYSGITGKN
jgi:hypothetical protein